MSEDIRIKNRDKIRQAKSIWFSSIKNKTLLTKRLHERYKNEGGTALSLSDFQILVPQNINKWPETKHLDAYESLVFDPLTEMDKINQDFIKWVWPSIVPDEMDAIKKPLDNTNWGPEEWRGMDIPREDLDKNTNNATYRYDNTIPLYQIQPARHYDYDADGSGYTGRSISSFTHGIWDTNDVFDISNKPYDQNDTNDFIYYGQPEDTSSTILINTAWKSGGSKASSIGV